MNRIIMLCFTFCLLNFLYSQDFVFEDNFALINSPSMDLYQYCNRYETKPKSIIQRNYSDSGWQINKTSFFKYEEISNSSFRIEETIHRSDNSILRQYNVIAEQHGDKIEFSLYGEDLNVLKKKEIVTVNQDNKPIQIDTYRSYLYSRKLIEYNEEGLVRKLTQLSSRDGANFEIQFEEIFRYTDVGSNNVRSDSEINNQDFNIRVIEECELPVMGIGYRAIKINSRDDIDQFDRIILEPNNRIMRVIQYAGKNAQNPYDVRNWEFSYNADGNLFDIMNFGYKKFSIEYFK